MPHSTRIAIVHRIPDSPSATFVRAHGEWLPGVVCAIEYHRGFVTANGQPVLSRHWPQLVFRQLLRMLFQQDLSREFDRACVLAFRQSKANVVLAEFGVCGVRVLNACGSAEVPLVVHFHGYDASKREIIERHADDYIRMFEQSAAVIGVSRFMEEKLLGLGCPRNKLVYNPYGVDCVRFKGADPAASEPKFVATGRMVEKKAPFLTLAAFALVLDAHPNAQLRLVGDGELLSLCRQLSDALGIAHAVTFLGAQPHSVVQQEMRNARAFVQHSVTALDGDSEGTPVAILEAGAMGLPVVATRHAGIPDVVLHGETGLLVSEYDVTAMAERMLALARNGALAATLGRNGATRVRKYYTMQQSIDRLARVLDAAASRQTLDQARQSIEDELPRPTLPCHSPLSGSTSRQAQEFGTRKQSVFQILNNVLGQDAHKHLLPYLNRLQPEPIEFCPA